MNFTWTVLLPLVGPERCTLMVTPPTSSASVRLFDKNWNNIGDVVRKSDTLGARLLMHKALLFVDVPTATPSLVRFGLEKRPQDKFVPTTSTVL